jgi:colanic acid/amylovoran biosynthesis protein
LSNKATIPQIEKVKVLILNSHSPNIGDLAIASSMVRTLKEVMPQAEFTILASIPQITSKYVDAKVLGYPGFGGWGWKGQIVNLMLLARNALWLQFRRLGLSLNFILDSKAKQTLPEYASADIILGCGGGYLHNFGQLDTLRPFYQIYLATLLPKPVMLYAPSIGPFRRKVARVIARHVLNRVDLITVRDEISLEFIRDLKIERTPVFVTADAALLLPPAPPERAKDILAQEGVKGISPLITITVTPFIGRWRRVGRWRTDYTEKISEYQSVIAYLANHIIKETDAHILFIPMDVKPESYVIKPASKTKSARIRDVIGKALEDGFSLVEETDLLSGIMAQIEDKDRAKILQGSYSPMEVKAIYALSTALIGTRMHSIILASTSGIPILAFAYEPKVASFMGMLGQDQYVIDINNLNPVEVTSKFDTLWGNRDKARETILAKTDILKQRAFQNARSASELLLSST